MCCRIDSPSQSTDHGESGSREAGAEPFRLSDSVPRGVARADDGDRHLILWIRLAAAKENTGRIVDRAEWPGIVAARFGQHIDVMIGRNSKLKLCVDFIACGNN